MHQRDWEVASRVPPLEYGAGSGYIASVDGRKVAQSWTPSLHHDADDFVLQGYAIRWHSLIRVNDEDDAFFGQNSIRGPFNDVKLHFDHDESRTIGTTEGGLILVPDEFGLA